MRHFQITKKNGGRKFKYYCIVKLERINERLIIFTRHISGKKEIIKNADKHLTLVWNVHVRAAGMCVENYFLAVKKRKTNK